MEFVEVVKNRYSCKKYDGKQISAEQLDAVLQAGRLAPTAKNLQGQRIYVVQSAEFRCGGCVNRRHPHDAGRDEHGRGQLLAELF